MAAFIDQTQYNDLPSLAEAEARLQAPLRDGIVGGPIRDVFLKHDMARSLCLYLQHRHHRVGPQEAVVKVNGTAHLMSEKDMLDVASIQNKVVPTKWMSIGREVRPMELAVMRDTATEPQLAPEFVSDSLSVCRQHGCDHLFGIDTMADSGWSEFKVGDASVVIPDNDSDHYDEGKFVPVAFAFDEQTPGFRVHGKCGKDHKHTSKP